MHSLLLATALLFAADSAKVWTNQELTSNLAAAKPDANKITQASLGHYYGYSMSVTRREASGIGELHENQTDLFVIESGGVHVGAGRQTVESENRSATEVRGSGITGGEKHHVSAGDVVPDSGQDSPPDAAGSRQERGLRGGESRV